MTDFPYVSYNSSKLCALSHKCTMQTSLTNGFKRDTDKCVKDAKITLVDLGYATAYQDAEGNHYRQFILDEFDGNVAYSSPN